MNNMAKNIVRALREGLWIDVVYKGQKRETYYWIAVKDINPETKKIKCDVINTKMSDSFQEDYKIMFDRIISAKVIEGTKCHVNENLIERIEDDPKLYDFLEHNIYQQNVLDYFIQCYKEDTVPMVSDFKLIKKINNDALVSEKEYNLTDTQFDKMIQLVKNNQNNKYGGNNVKDCKLCINLFSINTKQGLFPIVHKEVLFDIKFRKLVLEDNCQFNKEFLYGSRNKKLSFNNYFNFDIDEFVQHYEEKHQEYKDILNQNLYKTETVDTRPYLFELSKQFSINLENEYNAVNELSEEDKLTFPLKGFFGGLTRKNLRASKKTIVLLDEKVNIDQLRVIYSSVNNRITYVQGPPGTGKTRTILNVLITALYNSQKVLVTSNNNQPLDNILSDLSGFKTKEGNEISMPVFRLGNYDVLINTLKEINQSFYKYSEANYLQDEADDIKVYIGELQEIVTILDNYEERENKVEELNALKKLEEKLKGSIRSLKISQRIGKLSKEITDLPKYTNEDVIEKIIIERDILNRFLFNLTHKIYKMLKASKYSEVKENLIYPKSEKITKKHAAKLRKFLRDERNLSLFTDIFPVILSTNLSSYYVGPPKPFFDLTIMDEAGQCNPATALVPIIRGKRLLLVGDTNQLQPIVTIDENHNDKLMKIFRISNLYNYKENSILHIMQNADKVSKFILLKYHYRCTPEIIGFSNGKYYRDELIVMTQSDKSSIVLKHVNSEPDIKNVSTKEIVQIIKEIRSTRNQTVGIVTPFRAQANEIKKRLKEFGHEEISVGTVHTFQGDEKDKIIFSLGVTESTYQQSFDWIKNNRELINVATTRAKNKLVMVCDTKQVIMKSKTDPSNGVYELMKYIKNEGKYIVTDESSDIFKDGISRGKKLNSEYEEEFLITIEHILGFNEGLKVESKMRVADVLDEVGISKEDKQYFLQSHFDFVIYSRVTKLPLLAIEINGIEHYSDEAVKKRDQKKKEICLKKKMRLLSIPNDYVRRYELIKDEIINILK